MTKRRKQLDVFISYKREDYARVDQLAALLEDIKIRVWHDASLAAGELWPDRIEEMARRARAMIVCWTPAAARSEWIRREMEIGFERNILVPVQFGAGPLPANLRDYHVADMTTWAGEADHPGLYQLARGLEAVLAVPVGSRILELAGGQNPAAVAALRAHLIRLARKREPPISYEEARAVIAAKLIEGEATPLRNLFGTLDAIADQNRRRREPPLFGLVVNPDEGLPGKGYFEKHCFLEFDTELAESVHAAQLDAVYSYGWPEDP